MPHLICLQVVANGGQQLMAVRGVEGGVWEWGSIVDTAVYSRHVHCSALLWLLLPTALTQLKGRQCLPWRRERLPVSHAVLYWGKTHHAGWIHVRAAPPIQLMYFLTCAQRLSALILVTHVV